MSLNGLSYDNYNNIVYFINYKDFKNFALVSKNIYNFVNSFFSPVKIKNFRNMLVDIENENINNSFCGDFIYHLYKLNIIIHDNHINNIIIRANFDISAVIMFYDLIGNKLFDLFFEFNEGEYLMDKNKSILSYFDAKIRLYLIISCVITKIFPDKKFNIQV